ncbi:exostosin family protein [uncultured Winogradskyella sp.]|uniref:exostosin domain-containing protein n=1 Tax=uncultured Winogradskyella sp. TaxID=395353 RepID=UPI002634C746|nr:exostosin family protein [uncultured Winogradskyella sp.]
MILFFPNKHYDKNHRRHLFPMLKPFIKGPNFTDQQRIAQYGISDKDYTFTDKIEDAKFAILTMSWLYYKLTNQSEKAIQFIEKANKLNKQVLVFIPSDFGIKIPKHLDVIVLRAQGYKSKLNSKHNGLPVFVPDPLKKYYQTDTVYTRPYNTNPTVGFCGQADSNTFETIKELAKIALRNMLYYTGLRYKTPHQLIATKHLRYKLITRLKSNNKINSNFILRKAHRAGVEFLKGRNTHKTTYEFFDNIKDSDYVLCVRGVGNFSVRFYETLAMGRIPVFLNTDCILPHDDDLNWKNHVVWVDYKDRHRVADIVIDYHSRLDEGKLNAKFKENRRLWEDKLQLKSYFETIFNHLE